jgi:hypothetical protein
MRSPVVAMLWENWRLTRLEAAQRFVQGVVFGGAVLAGVAAFGTTKDSAARLALGLLVMTCMPLSLSVAKLNGGRMMDGYRPGYPFYFLYTRPVRTFVLVGAPVAYLVGGAVAVYIGAALVLRAAFGYPFLLWPLAAWIAAYHLAQWAVQWGTRNKTVQWIGSLAAGLGFPVLAIWRGQEWPASLDVSVGDYALLLAAGVGSFGLTVAGVARQRRGAAGATAPGPVTRSGVWDSLAGLFRFPCPSSSPTRAQVWFELRSSGLPVLVIGLALAIAIPLLLVATTRLDVMLSGFFAEPATRVVAVVVAMFSLPAVLILGGNAFRIRTRQGHRYASVFEATQASGTARTAGLTALVRAVCLHAALLGVVASIWASASIIPFDVLGDNDTFIAKSRSPVSGWMRAIEGNVGAMSARELIALAFVAFIAVAVMVGLRAALAALRARYPRRLKIAGSLLLLYGLVLVLRAKYGQGGDGLEVQLIEAFARAAPWMTAAAIALATVYLFWRSLAERLLTLRHVCGAILVSAAFAAAWWTVLRAAGVPLSEMPATDAFWMLSPAPLPLTVSLLAPWSLSRIRHT